MDPCMRWRPALSGRPHGRPISSSDADVKEDFIHPLFISVFILAQILWPTWEMRSEQWRGMSHRLPPGAPVAAIAILG